jgi:hypothetical protein
MDAKEFEAVAAMRWPALLDLASHDLALLDLAAHLKKETEIFGIR